MVFKNTQNGVNVGSNEVDRSDPVDLIAAHIDQTTQTRDS